MWLPISEINILFRLVDYTVVCRCEPRLNLMNTAGLSGWNGFCNRIWISGVILMNDKPISNLSQTQLRLINSHVETFDQVIKFLNHLLDRSNSWTKILLVSYLY